MAKNEPHFLLLDGKDYFFLADKKSKEGRLPMDNSGKV
jgi:hypothetical protein